MNLNQMSVTWTSGYGISDAEPFVQWGLKGGDHMHSPAETLTFTSDSMCGKGTHLPVNLSTHRSVWWIFFFKKVSHCTQRLSISEQVHQQEQWDGVTLDIYTQVI